MGRDTLKTKKRRTDDDSYTYVPTILTPSYDPSPSYSDPTPSYSTPDFGGGGGDFGGGGAGGSFD